VTDIFCGASFTGLELSSTVKPEVQSQIVNDQKSLLETESEESRSQQKEYLV
jgi:hypothetical protein